LTASSTEKQALPRGVATRISQDLLALVFMDFHARSLEIWTTQLATAREALAQAGVSAADVAAIGIANQRETTVVWNRKTGAPLCERHRLAGPPHGASLRGTGRARAGGAGTRQHRAGDRCLLFGHQAGLDTRSRCPAPAPPPNAANWPSAPSIPGCCGN
jgi:hypothetical protein